MKMIYGTGNPGKLGWMREHLEVLGIEVIGLKDVDIPFQEPEECGKSPLENARQKAEYYYSVFRQPVFSVDSGLYICGLSEEEQPGVHVRNVNGRRLSDSEMTEYYAGIAHRLGGKCMAQYRNAVCLIMSEAERYEYDEWDIGSNWFYLVDQPLMDQEKAGLPLDRISVDMEENDLKAIEHLQSNGGWHGFFRRVMNSAKMD